MSSDPLPPTSTEIPKDFSEFLDSTEAHVGAFVEEEKRYLQLWISDKVGSMAARIVPMLLMLPLLMIGVVLLVLCGAKAWGNYLNNETLGYLYTGLMVLGVCLVLFMARGAIGSPIHTDLVKSAAGEARMEAKDIPVYLDVARARRDDQQKKLLDHLQAVKDPAFRGVLLKDAVYDALSTTAPFKYVKGLFAGWNR